MNQICLLLANKQTHLTFDNSVQRQRLNTHRGLEIWSLHTHTSHFPESAINFEVVMRRGCFYQ